VRTRGTRLSRWILGCLSVLTLVAPPSPGLAQAAPDITLTVLQGGLPTPLGVVNAGDGTDRIFIVQQQGSIRIHTGTQLLPTAFLDIRTLLPPACAGTPPSCGESGLLGLAFHPDYESNGYFYVYYTDINGDEVIARYSVSSNPNIANPGSATILLRIQDPFANHNGGQIQFGADGYLYIGTGDGGAGGDPGNRAQNLQELLGKILRIDVDATGAVPCGQASPAPYGIPADNPFTNVPGACGEIWAYGVRNPWRFSFDRFNHDLYIGDVGETRYEEIDYQPGTSTGGENYGWRRMEGFHCFNPDTGCNDGSLKLPILEYGRSLGCSVTGGYVYRGSLYPQLFGVYLYADYCSGTIWGATRDNAGNWTNRQVGSSQFVSSFGEDEAGELYVVEHSGTVKKVVSSSFYSRPVLTALHPSAAIKGDPALTLTVDGTGFTPATVLRWNGSPRSTTYISRTRLTALIPASDIDSAGSATLTVTNPSPGGGVSTGKTFEITNMFLDVPLGHLLRRPIEGIAEAGITTGCGPRVFCPGAATMRNQMAILLLRADNDASYTPPPATGTVFADVDRDDFAADFIEELAALEITQGCGSGNYCPTAPVLRAPMAKLLLRTVEGPSYAPPPPGDTPIFVDVPATATFAAWIEECSRRGITTGCGGGKYCPNQIVTRAQMAAFLTRTFSIPLPQ
jgi:glucose/arabinose dehydrogenase